MNSTLITTLLTVFAAVMISLAGLYIMDRIDKFIVQWSSHHVYYGDEGKNSIKGVKKNRNGWIHKKTG